jgi:hypothetical protein
MQNLFKTLRKAQQIVTFDSVKKKHIDKANQKPFNTNPNTMYISLGITTAYMVKSVWLAQNL